MGSETPGELIWKTDEQTMLGRQWNKKRVRSLHFTFTEVWIKKFYVTIPIFFVVWSFAIPYMVYEMLFASILSFVYSDRIIDKIKWWTKR